MRRALVPFLVATLAVAFVALLIFGVLQTSDDTSLDQAIARGETPAAPAVDRSLPLLDGSGEKAVADYGGGYVIVNFFANWCDPCHSEAPLLTDLQRTLADTGQGTVLGVSWNDSIAKANAFVRRHDIDFPVVRDVDEKLGDAYDITGLPETFVVDPDGDVVALRRGELTRRWIDETLAPLLAAESRRQ